MKKRLVSILLCAAMLLTLLPMTALASQYTTLTFQEAVTVNTEVGGSYWFQFTPSVTQSYCIYSYDDDVVDPFATLYDSEKTKITNNDNFNDRTRNFRIVAELTAGETYYIAALD